MAKHFTPPIYERSPAQDPDDLKFDDDDDELDLDIETVTPFVPLTAGLGVVKQEPEDTDDDDTSSETEYTSSDEEPALPVVEKKPLFPSAKTIAQAMHQQQKEMEVKPEPFKLLEEEDTETKSVPKTRAVTKPTLKGIFGPNTAAKTTVVKGVSKAPAKKVASAEEEDTTEKAKPAASTSGSGRGGAKKDPVKKDADADLDDKKPIAKPVSKPSNVAKVVSKTSAAGKPVSKPSTAGKVVSKPSNAGKVTDELDDDADIPPPVKRIVVQKEPVLEDPVKPAPVKRIAVKKEPQAKPAASKTPSGKGGAKKDPVKPAPVVEDDPSDSEPSDPTSSEDEKETKEEKKPAAKRKRAPPKVAKFQELVPEKVAFEQILALLKKQPKFVQATMEGRIDYGDVEWPFEVSKKRNRSMPFQMAEHSNYHLFEMEKHHAESAFKDEDESAIAKLCPPGGLFKHVGGPAPVYAYDFPRPLFPFGLFAFVFPLLTPMISKFGHGNEKTICRLGCYGLDNKIPLEKYDMPAQPRMSYLMDKCMPALKVSRAPSEVLDLLDALKANHGEKLALCGYDLDELSCMSIMHFPAGQGHDNIKEIVFNRPALVLFIQHNEEPSSVKLCYSPLGVTPKPTAFAKGYQESHIQPLFHLDDDEKDAHVIVKKHLLSRDLLLQFFPFLGSNAFSLASASPSGSATASCTVIAFMAPSA